MHNYSRKKMHSLVNVNGMMFPDLISKCNNAQKECINCNLDVIVNICKRWMETTRPVNVPLNCQNNSFKILQNHKYEIFND